MSRNGRTEEEEEKIGPTSQRGKKWVVIRCAGRALEMRYKREDGEMQLRIIWGSRFGDGGFELESTVRCLCWYVGVLVVSLLWEINQRHKTEGKNQQEEEREERKRRRNKLMIICNDTDHTLHGNQIEKTKRKRRKRRCASVSIRLRHRCRRKRRSRDGGKEEKRGKKEETTRAWDDMAIIARFVRSQC